MSLIASIEIAGYFRFQSGNQQTTILGGSPYAFALFSRQTPIESSYLTADSRSVSFRRSISSAFVSSELVGKFLVTRLWDDQGTIRSEYRDRVLKVSESGELIRLSVGSNRDPLALWI